MAITADVARGVVLDDRYRLENVIGQGGMATVYRAHDLVLARDVAIKLFPPVAEDADDLLRHQAEMRVLAQMSHPGLVTLHDAGSAYAGGPMQQTYLVMELVTGPTLAERLARGPLTPVQTALVGRQLAEALAAVHTSDVVHRDVKPANVLFVDPDGLDGAGMSGTAVSTGPVVKLADFGIARLSDGARLTMTGTTLGTATYLSPEQAAGGAVGPATDVYALGLVLLECLTGRKAFTGTIVEVAAARLNTAPPIPEDVEPDWAELLEGMTRREPQARFTADEVARALTAILQGGSPMAAASPADDVPRRRRRARAARPLAVPPSELLVSDAAHVPDDSEGTRRYSTEELRAEAKRASAAAPARPGASASPSVRPRRRSFGAILVGAAAVVIAAGALFVSQVAQDTAEASDAPVYPRVDGIMGDALTDLQESVEP